MKPETRFKVKVLARLKDIDELWAFKTQMIARLGIPDIIGCYKGKFFAWELKKDFKAPITFLQEFILKKISEAGGISEIVYPENFEEKLRDLLG